MWELGFPIMLLQEQSSIALAMFRCLRYSVGEFILKRLIFHYSDMQIFISLGFFCRKNFG